MKYSLANSHEVERARQFLDQLIDKKVVVEIKRIMPRRSLAQNSYLHLLISAFGLHFGYTNEEAKFIYKEINKDVYVYTKKGRKFYRSSADLTKEEMTKTIDRFRLKSAENGYELPLASDVEWLRELDNLIEQSRYYL